jgi:hypothetical protein
VCAHGTRDGSCTLWFSSLICAATRYSLCCSDQHLPFVYPTGVAFHGTSLFVADSGQQCLHILDMGADFRYTVEHSWALMCLLRGLKLMRLASECVLSLRGVVECMLQALFDVLAQHAPSVRLGTRVAH